MTETHDTRPVFPPGRYGRRRDPRRRRWLPVLLAAVVAVASVGIAVRLYRQYGDPSYAATRVRYRAVTDTSVTVDFTVRVPPGGSAVCDLRARAYDAAVVGTARTTVTAAPGATSVDATAVVPTTGRPFIGEVLRCRAPG